ncbi:MAG: DNA-binding protein [Candidatus Rokuibacteriota bacterium]|nr:MAG: DNA-binding protein [Candidatus Rokubacteria bacterium]
MNRYDLRELARQRVREARQLLRARAPHGAYYLAGYAVECALKACIAKKTQRYEFPSRQAVNESYTHDLKKLLRLADLERALDQETRDRARLGVNWDLVKDWTEQSRYDAAMDMRRARELYRAIAGRPDGVLPWVRRHW